MAQDYYTILGVKKSASDKEVRQAYRRLARKYHPDVNRGDPSTEERFKEVNEAYQVLSDPDTRSKYDRYGENWKYADQLGRQQATSSGRGPFTWTSQRGGPRQDIFDSGDVGFGDLLGDLFGRRGGRSASTARRQTLEQSVEVTLEEAYQGTTRVVTLTNPGGTQRRLEVKIPPGVDTGSRVKVSPKGRPGAEFYLAVTVQPHLAFQRKGGDMYTEVSVPLYDALLGGEVRVPTLKGQVALTLPPETQNGRVFRLAGQGMPAQGQPQTKGDLLVTVKVELPQGLNEEEEELLRRLKTLRS